MESFISALIKYDEYVGEDYLSCLINIILNDMNLEEGIINYNIYNTKTKKELEEIIVLKTDQVIKNKDRYQHMIIEDENISYYELSYLINRYIK